MRTEMRVPFPPIEPPAPVAGFPDPRGLGTNEVVSVSRTLSPGLVLAAYRQGIFPWPVSERVVPWVSPNPRAIFQLDQPPDWPRSLRKTLRKPWFRVTVNQAFREVVHACATERDGGTWITHDVLNTYSVLHQMGWSHSVEVWDEASTLVGGLYGITIGGAFAGESMFHRRTDASKIAFVHLVERLRARGFVLLDAQVLTEHLASLGCVSVPRDTFLARLHHARELSVSFVSE